MAKRQFLAPYMVMGVRPNKHRAPTIGQSDKAAGCRGFANALKIFGEGR
jgi:hypothetical protein